MRDQRLRVALLTPHYDPGRVTGGAARYVEAVFDGLRAKGHQVVLFCYRDHRDQADAPNVVRLPVGRLPMIRALGVSRRLAPLLGPDRFDSVFNHFTPLGACVDGLPQVVFLHSTMIGIAHHSGSRAERVMRNTLGAHVERRVLARAEQVLCVNHHIVEEARRGYRTPAGKLSVVGAGVDCERFRPGPQRNSAPGRLLCVGRLVPLKRIDLALRVLAEARRVLPGLTMTVAGDGPERVALERLASSLGIGEAVCFAGLLDDEHLLPVFQQADLLLFFSSHEGMPLAVLEALASGLPVLATHFAGADALIPSGVGQLAESEEPAALAAQLVAMLGNVAALRETGRQARMLAIESFPWARRIDEIERVLLSVSRLS